MASGLVLLASQSHLNPSCSTPSMPDTEGIHVGHSPGGSMLPSPRRGGHVKLKPSLSLPWMRSQLIQGKMGRANHDRASHWQAGRAQLLAAMQAQRKEERSGHACPQSGDLPRGQFPHQISTVPCRPWITDTEIRLLHDRAGAPGGYVCFSPQGRALHFEQMELNYHELATVL